MNQTNNLLDILQFWKSHPQYWISLKNREEIDKEITDLFYNFPLKNSNWIESVIYLDQFVRHFQRHLRLSEEYVEASRRDAVEIVFQNEGKISELDEVELIFCLMPFKHLKYYSYIFEKIHNVWLPKANRIKDYRYLSKFYYDTYKKYFNFEFISKSIRSTYKVDYYSNYFDPKSICEYYSTNYINYKNINNIYPKIINIDNPIISLSGGVDSMVLLYYYHIIGSNPVAVHIIYGNRMESESEYNFIVEYCYNLNVPLYTFHIKWIRRDNVDRDFYESITRDIRFMVYRAVGGRDCNVILGHIRDDVVENIWTNIATCRHLDNLKRMKLCDRQKDVVIWRPFIDIDKNKILEIAHTIGIPYLKNTTPEWSNRGKYRNHFYQSIQQQYGDGVDDRIIRFAEMVSSQSKIIDELLYKSILDSHSEGIFDITIAIDANISEAHWEQIFERIFHQILKCNKCSIHSVRNFYERISKFTKDIKNTNTNYIKIQIKKDIQIEVYTKNYKYYMKFIKL